MKTTYSYKDDACYIKVFGPMNNIILFRVKEKMRLALEQGIKEIWVDCKDMTDVDLSILGSLALYQHVLEERHVKLTLLHLTPQQQSILVQNQLDTVLPVADESDFPFTKGWYPN